MPYHTIIILDLFLNLLSLKIMIIITLIINSKKIKNRKKLKKK